MIQMTISDISVRLGTILLAAGGSRRLGQPKQLVMFHGEALVARSTRLLLGLGVEDVLVITGSDSGKVLSQIEKYEEVLEKIFDHSIILSRSHSHYRIYRLVLYKIKFFDF